MRYFFTYIIYIQKAAYNFMDAPGINQQIMPLYPLRRFPIFRLIMPELIICLCRGHHYSMTGNRRDVVFKNC